MYHKENEFGLRRQEEPFACNWDEQSFWPSKGRGEGPEFSPLVEDQELIVAVLEHGVVTIRQRVIAVRINGNLWWVCDPPEFEKIYTGRKS